MEPGLRRAAGVNTSTLVRQLSAWTSSAAPATEVPAALAEPSLAARLAGWLDWTDAITLSGAVAPLAAAERLAPGQDLGVLLRQAAAERDHACSTLLREIESDPLLAPAEPQRRADPRLAAAAPLPADEPPDDAAYRQNYAAIQRMMAERIGALRARLRTLLQRASLRLARLAALDAALEDTLRLRERHLLSHVPALAEPRFAQARAQGPDGRAALGRELQALLRAELSVRLQPVEGLLEALEQEGKRQA